MIRSSQLPPLVLASASPRRQELLRGLGLSFDVCPAGVDESPETGIAPEQLVRRLASDKATQVHRQRPDALILAADTLVVLDAGRILGKPGDAGEARSMLRLLSGRDHRVLTGVALCGPDGTVCTEMATTGVRFAPLTDPWIAWYVSTGEPLDKAGAYGVQGSAALFVEGLQGSWSNVVGLPLERLPALFRAAGHDLLEFLPRR